MPCDIEVRESRHGRGVFATRRFEAGDLVERCPTLEVPEGDVSGLLGDYIFSSTTEGHVVLVLGYGMLYNHSGDANLEYVQGGPDEIEFRAVRAIEPDEELTIDYQGEWWESRGLEPD
jgi:uncharacterized protein